MRPRSSAPRFLARRASLVLAAAAASVVASAPTEARAFCRTRTVAVAADFQPGPGNCWDKGQPLFWRNSCVGYNVHRAASRQVSLDDAMNALSRAFTKWTGTSCPTNGDGRSRVSIDVRDLGPVECGEVALSNEGPNQNVIAFRDDAWPYEGDGNTLALTIVRYDKDTGEIFGADMIINSHDNRVTLTDPVPDDGYDFASIVTHEAGHFLGLAHSGDTTATMAAHYKKGATAMRNLTADDIAGICDVYNPDGDRAVLDAGTYTAGGACDPTPKNGFTSRCAPPNKSCTGSSQVAAAAPPLGAASCVFAASVVALIFRRVTEGKRRRSRRRP